MADIVTARVPSEIRRQGNEALRALGATPTQLINAAYEYVIEHGSLPSRRCSQETSEGNSGSSLDGVVRRVLDADAARELGDLIAGSTFDIPESFWGGRSYKEMIAEGRRADYEALA